jgi:hypothetical protein
MRGVKTRWKAERIAEYSGLSSMIRSKRLLKSVIIRIGLERGTGIWQILLRRQSLILSQLIS